MYSKSIALAAIVAFAAGALVGPVSGAAASGLFSGLAGAWAGDGTLKLAGGTSERIRCRATYEVDAEGNKLTQDLRCASDSYTLLVTSDVTYNPAAGVITGIWQETNYSAGGFLTGNASPGQINARVSGNNFSARVAIVTGSGEQVVTIRPENLDVTEVAVTLRRAG